MADINHGHRKKRLAGLWILCLTLLIFCVYTFTRNNTFSVFCHPEEQYKARQILKQKRNFHHPLLMLTSAEAAVALLGTERSVYKTIIVGRWVSAIYASLGVVALTLLAFQLRGLSAAINVGVICATTPRLFYFAHFMKEDATLLGTLALFLYALCIDLRSRSLKTAAFLGAACALTASSKYIGIAAAIFGLLHVIIGGPSLPKRARIFRFALFILIFCAFVLGANYQVFTHFDKFVSGLAEEFGHVRAGGHHHIIPNLPSIRYLYEMGRISPLVLAGVVFHVASMKVGAQHRSGAEWIVTLFPFVYAGILLISPLTSGRYFLPVTVGFGVLAGLGLAELQKTLVRKWQYASRKKAFAVTAFLLLATVASHWPLWGYYYKSFQSDSRRELIQWIIDNVPEDAFIAQDLRIGLPMAQSSVPPPEGWGNRPDVLSSLFVADLGTLDELRAQGIGYVVVIQDMYGPLFRKEYRRAKSNLSREQFYDQLFREGRLLWELPREDNIYLHPGIRIYYVGQKKAEKE